MRAAQEVTERRKSELARIKQDYNNKLKESETKYQEEINKLKEKHQQLSNKHF